MAPIMLQFQQYSRSKEKMHNTTKKVFHRCFGGWQKFFEGHRTDSARCFKWEFGCSTSSRAAAIRLRRECLGDWVEWMIPPSCCCCPLLSPAGRGQQKLWSTLHPLNSLGQQQPWVGEEANGKEWGAAEDGGWREGVLRVADVSLN